MNNKKSKRKLKKRRNAYVFFLKEYQNNLKKKNNFSFSECSKLCAAKWKHMPEQQKQKYIEMSLRDAVRYKKEMKTFNPKELKIARKPKNFLEPVKPLSAYIWFCQQRFKSVSQKLPKKNNGYVIKTLARMWAKCDENTKKKFEECSECDKQCYQDEMKAYLSQIRK